MKPSERIREIVLQTKEVCDVGDQRLMLTAILTYLDEQREESENRFGCLVPNPFEPRLK